VLEREETEMDLIWTVSLSTNFFHLKRHGPKLTPIDLACFLPPFFLAAHDL